MLLEKALGRDLLFLPCRHHTCELVLQNVFIQCLQIKSTGPEILLFKRFKALWPSIDKSKFQPGIAEKKASLALLPVKQEILCFASNQLKVIQNEMSKYIHYLREI